MDLSYRKGFIRAFDFVVYLFIIYLFCDGSDWGFYLAYFFMITNYGVGKLFMMITEKLVGVNKDYMKVVDKLLKEKRDLKDTCDRLNEANKALRERG